MVLNLPPPLRGVLEPRSICRSTPHSEEIQIFFELAKKKGGEGIKLNKVTLETLMRTKAYEALK